MARRKSKLKGFVIFLAIILLVVGICAIIANSQNDKSLPTAELSQWMGMIKDDALLKKIVIPGAHDAGTKGIAYLGETQDRDTAQLLACGTRYLDLRIATKSATELAVYHGPFKGVLLPEVLGAVKDFLVANPTEVVILDFQHFSGDTAPAATVSCLMETLGDKLVENLSNQDDVTFVDTLTLGQVRGQCLVVWGDNFEVTEGNPIFKRNDDEGNRSNCVIHSYYEGSLNKKGSATYIETALPHYIDLYKQQNSGLFVLQGQLTDGLFVFGPHFREATHTKKMNAYLESLKTSPDLDIINIIIRDFISPAKNCAALQLNLNKDLVKSECKSDFTKMIFDNN